MFDEFVAFSGRDSARGLHFYRAYDLPPRFVPFTALAGNIALAMAALRAQGVGPGTRVLFPFETSEALIVAFFALIGVGALPLSVRPHLFATSRASYCEFIAAVQDRFGAAAIIDAPSLAGLELPLPRLVLPAPVVDPPPAARPIPGRADDELVFVQFSSGSTAFPKGVPISAGALRHNLNLITRHDGRDREHSGSLWLPLFHDMGLVGGLLTCLLVGHDLHIARPTEFLMDPLGWLSHLSGRKITHTVVPNLAIDYCVRHLRSAEPAELADLDLSALRTMYLGSEPINIDNLATFTATLAPHGLRPRCIQPCYGMAEAVLMVSCTPSERDYRVVTRANGQRAISSGEVDPSFGVEIRDDDGRVLPPGELGEIHLCGGSLAPRYFDPSSPLLADDGFYATGDLGFLDGDDLFIAGRAGDRFKIHGESYFASDLEHVIEGLPCVRPGRVAVIHVDGRVIILAEPTNRAVAQAHAEHAATIIDRVAASSGIKLDARDVWFVRRGEIKHTSSGKLRRRALAEAFAAGQLRRADSGDDQR